MNKYTKLMASIIAVSLCVTMVGTSASAESASAGMVSESYSAVPTSSGMYINGSLLCMQAYNINDYNYFKLRELALVLSGTEKQFNVGYDSAKDAIAITTGTAYVPLPNETLSTGSSEARTAVPTASNVYIDGVLKSFTAYQINNSNYFKLRDIAAVLNFSVDYDEASNSIVVDTTASYAGNGSGGANSGADHISDPAANIASGLVGEWWSALASAGELGFWASDGMKFDADGTYYSGRKVFGSSGGSTDDGLVSMPSLYQDPLGYILGQHYYRISNEGAFTYLSNGEFTFVKQDSTFGLEGTWRYTGPVSGLWVSSDYCTVDCDITLTFNNDGSVNMVAWEKVGTYRVYEGPYEDGGPVQYVDVFYVDGGYFTERMPTGNTFMRSFATFTKVN